MLIARPGVSDAWQAAVTARRARLTVTRTVTIANKHHPVMCCWYPATAGSTNCSQRSRPRIRASGGHAIMVSSPAWTATAVQANVLNGYVTRRWPAAQAR